MCFRRHQRAHPTLDEDDPVLFLVDTLTLGCTLYTGTHADEHFVQL